MTRDDDPKPTLRIGMREAEARAQLPDKRTLGPQRAVLLCEHSPRSSYPIAEVWGDTVIANGERYSLEHCTSGVVAICTKHALDDGQWMIDLPALRAALRVPRRRALRVKMDELGRRVPADE